MASTHVFIPKFEVAAMPNGRGEFLTKKDLVVTEAHK